MLVSSLWRYPVKSLQGEQVAEATVLPDGIAGDREWGIRDERTGRILTARRRPELLTASATSDDGVPTITLPDGTTLPGPGPNTDRVLSEWLDAPVSLVRAAQTGPGRAEFFADATDDTSQAIEWTMPEDRYVDAASALVLTTASLRAARALHPAGTWDVRRFRPNVLLDLGGEGWIEDQWAGRPLRLGTAVLRGIQPCIRCTMVTRAQPGLDEDRDIFRTLARHHGGLFGLWCDVVTPGLVAAGDIVELADVVSPAPA